MEHTSIGYKTSHTLSYDIPPNAKSQRLICMPKSNYYSFTNDINKKPLSMEGNKLIVPSTFLNCYSEQNIEYKPLFFKIFSPIPGVSLYGGIEKFSDLDQMVFLPDWMMDIMNINAGDKIKLVPISIPKGTYVKFKVKKDFLELSDPKAILEYHLRYHAVISQHDTIVIKFLGKDYHIDVEKTLPTSSISLINTDIKVEFEEITDIPEITESQEALQTNNRLTKPTNNFFQGIGHKLK